jgi:hypothetical protein
MAHGLGSALGSVLRETIAGRIDAPLANLPLMCDNIDPEIYWRPGYDLMLEEARRSIDSQQQALDELRSRAATLVGVASLIAGVFGFTSDATWTLGAGVALGGFVVAGGAGLFVLCPRTWFFDLRPAEIDLWFSLIDPNDEGVVHMLRSAALTHQADYDANKDKLRWMTAAIFWMIIGLEAEALGLMAWVFGL